ncbi:hypothetical protein Tco_0630543 [Tanacetum coccineum]
MTKLTQKKIKFEWGDKQEAAFQLLKQKLCSAPILALPEERRFHRILRASEEGFGAANIKSETLGNLVENAKISPEAIREQSWNLRAPMTLWPQWPEYGLP